MTTQETTSTTHQIILALEELRDEVQVQAHLGTMQMREHWDHLGHQLSNLHAELEHEGDRASETAKEAVSAAIQVFRALLKRHNQTNDLGNHRVSEVMRTHVLTCTSNESLGRAAELMWKGDCGSIPVTDDGNRLVGMITDRDVCMAAYTQGFRLKESPVETAMSHQIHTCSTQTTLAEALASMREHLVRRLPVTDDNQILVGIITLGDIARHVHGRESAAELSSAQGHVTSTISQISEPRGGPSLVH